MPMHMPTGQSCSWPETTRTPNKSSSLWFSDIGFDPLDVGTLRQARLLEPLAMLWIELARKRGRGPNFAFSLQQRGFAP